MSVDSISSPREASRTASVVVPAAVPETSLTNLKIPLRSVLYILLFAIEYVPLVAAGKEMVTVAPFDASTISLVVTSLGGPSFQNVVMSV